MGAERKGGEGTVGDNCKGVTCDEVGCDAARCRAGEVAKPMRGVRKKEAWEATSPAGLKILRCAYARASLRRNVLNSLGSGLSIMP